MGLDTEQFEKWILIDDGVDVVDVRETFTLDDEDTTCDVALAGKFRDYCNRGRKPAFESYKFWQRQQS